MSEIQGRHVLITGGASGIGRLMARKLAALGARVSVWDIDREKLDKVVAELATGPGAGARLPLRRLQTRGRLPGRRRDRPPRRAPSTS